MMKEEEKINKQNQENIKKNSVREDLDNIVKDIKDISKSKFEQKDIFWIAPIIVMLMGILPWPIGYYTLLRIIPINNYLIVINHRKYKKER